MKKIKELTTARHSYQLRNQFFFSSLILLFLCARLWNRGVDWLSAATISNSFHVSTQFKYKITNDGRSINQSKPNYNFFLMLIQFILSLIQFNNSQRADCANNIRFTINLITKLQRIELQFFLKCWFKSATLQRADCANNIRFIMAFWNWIWWANRGPKLDTEPTLKR